VTQDLVGGEEGISDAGLSLSRLIINPILFLEATAEVYRGESPELFSAPERHDLTYVGRLRGYRDVTESTNLDFGGSYARGTAKEGEGLHTSLIGADVTLRWRPLRRAIQRLVEDPLSEKLLWKEFRAGQTIIVDALDGEIVFDGGSIVPPEIPPVELAGSTE
jgi:hypothetical protein